MTPKKLWYETKSQGIYNARILNGLDDELRVIQAGRIRFIS